MATAKKSSVKKSSTRKKPAKTSPAAKKLAKRIAAKKSSAKESAAKKKPAKSKSASVPKSMPKGGKDPKGGLTAKGRKFFNERDGSHLRPGVKGKADTPEKMLRKGSFLRRHFANPQGPVKDEDGQPTRQALEAAAWGESVPKNKADERKLAKKGAELLSQYHEAKGDKKAPSRGKKPAKKAGTSSGTKRAKSAGKPKKS